MRKTRASLWVLAVTAATVGLMIAMPITPRAAVVTDTIRRGTLTRTLAVEATIRYADETPIVALTDSVITWVGAREGDAVRKGELLCRLDTSADELALRQAIHTLEAQNAGLEAMGESARALAASATTEAQWNAEALKASIESKSLRAPMDCVVQRVYAREGQPVAQASPLLTLRGESAVLVATIPAQDAEMLRVGMNARVSVDDRTIATARVVSFGAPTEAGGMLWQSVTFEPDNGLALLKRVGDTAEIDVLCETREDVVLAPLEALTDRRTLWVIRDHKATELAIETGHRNAESVEVAALLEGETVVLNPDTEKLREGCAVKRAKP